MAVAKKRDASKAGIWGGIAGGLWSCLAAIYSQPEAANHFERIGNVAGETAAGFIMFAVIAGGLVSARNIISGADDDDPADFTGA